MAAAPMAAAMAANHLVRELMLPLLLLLEKLSSHQDAARHLPALQTSAEATAALPVAEVQLALRPLAGSLLQAGGRWQQEAPRLAPQQPPSQQPPTQHAAAAALAAALALTAAELLLLLPLAAPPLSKARRAVAWRHHQAASPAGCGKMMSRLHWRLLQRAVAGTQQPPLAHLPAGSAAAAA